MNLKENMVFKDKNKNLINRSKQKVQPTLQLVDAITKNNLNKFKRFQDRNLNVSHINYKVFHLLHDPYIFINAYAKILKNRKVLVTKVLSDENDQITQINAINISEKFKRNAYFWQPAKRTLIPKLSQQGKKRTLEISTQQNNIVQEAIRNILECIYEPEFVDFENKTNFRSTNFGFRPNKSCFKAVKNFKLNSQSCNYIIEGDVSSIYNSMNHDILLKVLEKRIKDKKFINLIKQLLNSRIMEENHYVHSLSGIEQGEILFPLLFNIYMFEFDKFIYKIISIYSIKQNPQKSSTHDIIPVLPILQNCIFVRYSDNWIFGINATKKQTEIIKKKIRKFLGIFLKLDLKNTKTNIKHYQRDGVCFLGYQMKMWPNKQLKIKTTISQHKKKFIRTNQNITSRKITIRPEKDRIIENLYQRKICKKDGYPIGVRAWSILEEYRIVERYKSIMLGITNYYINCDNLYILNQVSYILQYSCAKTLAIRKKMTMSQIFQKYGKKLQICFETRHIHKNKVTQRSVEFLTLSDLKKTGFIDKGKSRASIDKAHDPFHLLYYNRTKVKLFSYCCICGDSDKVVMYNIKSLQLSKEKKLNYLENRPNNLQIPVCETCYFDITHGRYDAWIFKI